MTDIKYYPPLYAKGEFHCPHCKVFAKQFWAHIEAQHLHADHFIGITVSTFREGLEKEWRLSKCEHCEKKCIWLGKDMIYPRIISVAQPNEDLEQTIQKDYLEAANILNESPRATAALLRLALQKLCKQLGQKGENINDDIGNLVKAGLNHHIQKSLDILRITGNNAVHPGEINLEEDKEKVYKLFELLNFIAQKMITEPKEISRFYENLPEDAKKAVKKRDG
ncbi:MAG: DUF4145 domain-containing protein [Candidatus Omnitrophota bacterium]